MRILWWTPHFWPSVGGIEILATRVLPALQERHHELAVVTSRSEFEVPDETILNGIVVHRYPFVEALAKRDPGEIVGIRHRIASLKRTFRPDLVHVHHPGPVSYFHLSTSRAHPCPTLLTVHTPFPDARDDPDTVFGQTLREAAWVTAVSRATLADTIRGLPDVERRSSVIYNGVAAPALPPAPLPFDAPRILYVGRLALEKGVDLAIDAFAAIRGRFPRAHLTIAGDGPARTDLERQASARGLATAVTFLGWVHPERIPPLMNASTLVVVPSRYREPFALVAVEAALLARPVVAARAGGLEETVADGETGLLFEREQVGALADAIAHLLDHPDTATRMGLAARERALERFSLETCVSAYDALYRRLAGDGATPRDRPARDGDG